MNGHCRDKNKIISFTQALPEMILQSFHFHYFYLLKTNIDILWTLAHIFRDTRNFAHCMRSRLAVYQFYGKI